MKLKFLCSQAVFFLIYDCELLQEGNGCENCYIVYFQCSCSVCICKKFLLLLFNGCVHSFDFEMQYLKCSFSHFQFLDIALHALEKYAYLLHKVVPMNHKKVVNTCCLFKVSDSLYCIFFIWCTFMSSSVLQNRYWVCRYWEL